MIAERANGRPPGSRDRHGKCLRRVPREEALRQVAKIGARIRQFCADLDISATELAAATGHHVQSVHRWLCGRGNPPLVACYQIAAALGLPIADLVDGETP